MISDLFGSDSNVTISYYNRNDSNTDQCFEHLESNTDIELLNCTHLDMDYPRLDMSLDFVVYETKSKNDTNITLLKNRLNAINTEVFNGMGCLNDYENVINKARETVCKLNQSYDIKIDHLDSFNSQITLFTDQLKELKFEYEETVKVDDSQLVIKLQTVVSNIELMVKTLEEFKLQVDFKTNMYVPDTYTKIKSIYETLNPIMCNIKTNCDSFNGESDSANKQTNNKMNEIYNNYEKVMDKFININMKNINTNTSLKCNLNKKLTRNCSKNNTLPKNCSSYKKNPKQYKSNINIPKSCISTKIIPKKYISNKIPKKSISNNKSTRICSLNKTKPKTRSSNKTVPRYCSSNKKIPKTRRSNIIPKTRSKTCSSNKAVPINFSLNKNSSNELHLNKKVTKNCILDIKVPINANKKVPITCSLNKRLSSKYRNKTLKSTNISEKTLSSSKTYKMRNILLITIIICFSICLFIFLCMFFKNIAIYT